MTVPPLADFAVVPRLMGIWHSEFIALDGDARETRRFHSTITQKIEGGRWVQSNENIYADGSSDTWRFFGDPISPTEVRLESPDAPYDGFRMLVREVADNIVLLQVWDIASGAVLATETFTLVDAGTRVRTIQQFSPPDGALRGFMAVKERRVA